MRFGFTIDMIRLVLALLLLLKHTALESVASSVKSSEDLYSILGVPRTASAKDIKSAYRRKAKDTHPDKNKDVSAEEAAAEFHKVVHAFEVLSDGASRRRYDNGGGDGTGTGFGGGSSQQQWQHWHFFHQQRRKQTRVLLKDKFEVKQAQSRLLHVVSLDQLRTIMLDDDDRLERHLLLCFFTPSIESLVNDEIVFPYPFAGMSPQSIWWEDLLQTVSIRFHRSNDLTRYFNIGDGDNMAEPVFLFVKKGTILGEEESILDTANFNTFTTSNREAFENWMWSMIEVKVIFHNQHTHPVEMYWISGTRANLKKEIQPNSSWTHYSMLTHEFYARDTRVDDWDGSPGRWKLSTNSGLGSWKIGVVGGGDSVGSPPIGEDGSVVIDIPHKECLDLSGHCGFWANGNQCNENPGFMKARCMLTCGHCNNNIDDAQEEEEQTCNEN